MDPYGIDLNLIYQQAISNIAENGYILEDIFVSQQGKFKRSVKSLAKVVIIPGLRKEITDIYREQLHIENSDMHVYEEGRLSFAAESRVAYIAEEGTFLKQRYIVMDEQDYNHFQQIDNLQDVWKEFINEASRVTNQTDEYLDRQVIQVVYGGRERQLFSELLNDLPDNPRERGGHFESLIAEVEKNVRRLGRAKKTIYDQLPPVVGEALKLTRLARMEKFKDHNMKLWSINKFSDYVKLHYKAAEKKHRFLSISELAAPEGWLNAMYDIFKSWSDIKDKVEALRKLMRKAALPHNQNPELDEMVAETIDFVNKQGLLPDVTVDNVYLIPEHHVIRKAQLPGALGSPEGGSHFFIYDRKQDKGIELFNVTVYEEDSVVRVFFTLVHELTHGVERKVSLDERPYSQPYDYPVIVDIADSNVMHNVFNEGAVVYFTDRMALPILYTDTPGITRVKESMLRRYKERNTDDVEVKGATVDQLTKKQIDRLYYWFIENEVVDFDYLQRTQMVKIIKERYGDGIMEDFLFKKDFSQFEESLGHLFPFINILILSRSNYVSSQIHGIKNEFWNGHAFTLIQHMLAKPYYDELDFFMDLLGLLGRDTNSMWTIDHDWVGLGSSAWKGDPTDAFQGSFNQRHFARQAVLKALMRDLGVESSNLDEQTDATTPIGGIDLDPASLEFDRQGPGFKAMDSYVPLINISCPDQDKQSCDQWDFQDFEILPVQGLRPAIFGVEPITNLHMTLGLSTN